MLKVCNTHISVLICSVLREWEYFCHWMSCSRARPRRHGVALLSPKAAAHHGWSAHPPGPKGHVGRVAGPLPLAELHHDHSTPKPSAETTRDTHLAVQHRRKSVDAGVTLWGSITHRGGWDLMWGKRETPEVT